MIRIACQNFLRFRLFGPELWAKSDCPKMGRSHFSSIFCGKVNVIVCYMGTFFQAMVLKLCTGFLDHNTDCVSKFFAISSIRARFMGKKGFS